MGMRSLLSVRTIFAFLALVALLATIACKRTSSEETPHIAAESQKTPIAPTESAMDTKTYKKPTEAELKERLSSMEFEVTQRDATEPPFRNRFWDNHEAGLYVDVTTGEPLFASNDKFESGTGWPSFTRPVDKSRVVEKTDDTLGMTRVEARSAAGNAHLGHVFPDGPRTGANGTGLRYCINSASLRFVPLADLEKEGYGSYRAYLTGAESKPGVSAAATNNSCTAPAPGDKAGCATTFDTAVLAGGCFWGMEEILRKVPGIVETEVGYTGGNTSNPTYEDVHTGKTGHAEAIRITFDATKITYAEILEKYFFKMHDPTTKDRQGNDLGSQYRSAIFFQNDGQKRIAEEVKAKVDKSGKWGRPVVTEIVKASTFTLAESYHQDYLEKHPGGYTCHFMRE